MKRWLVLLSCLVFIFSAALCACPAQAKDVYYITVNGAINPPVASFIREAIEKTQAKGAEALIILLDTPGGLDTSMREIVKNIMDASIPVVVYVYPSGARAASAGSIILMASHIAAMAPGTNVGAAHPVSIGKEKPDKVMEKKILQDAEAYSRSIAMKRGRNVEWAAKAVTESSSITAKDALDKHVIDLVADNMDDLLAKIDGRTVETKNGKVTLKTKGAVKTEIPMSSKYKLLSYLSDPNIAYLLMMLGIYGILFELYSPGTIFPGVIGGISIILALYAFQTIPISFAGLALILLGVIFFILELKIITHGLLGIAGIISIVIGSVMLVNVPSSAFSISWETILIVAVASALFVFGVLGYAVRAQLSKVKTGVEGLVGEIGVAETDILAKGKVSVHGELWNAKSDEPVNSGEEVVVISVERLIVKVKKIKGG
ncbi:MAG TPA: nodulation protein NfeD [Syntrophorhabdaceae bacterium]|nr:nodulation protein NfeD [Syntrophorhabdaceae bacterium]